MNIKIYPVIEDIYIPHNAEVIAYRYDHEEEQWDTATGYYRRGNLYTDKGENPIAALLGNDRSQHLPLSMFNYYAVMNHENLLAQFEIPEQELSAEEQLAHANEEITALKQQVKSLTEALGD